MDFSQIISANRLSDNQLQFDQAAMERSILRAEERHEERRAAWQKILELGGTITQFPRLIAILILGRRHS